MKEIYDFLSNLKVNNNKEWFDKNKDSYLKAKQQFTNIIEVLINEIRSFDPEMPPLEAKDCIFRIYRDVRFSNDKTPYKTYSGGYIAKGGRKGIYPGYYFHIQPGECFLSGGIYMPQPAILKAIRNEIYYHSDEYLSLINNPEFKATFRLFDEDKLKTNPKDFPKDFEHIDLLRYRSYAPHLPFTDEQLLSSNLLDFVISKFRIMRPYNKFLNEAISNIE